MVRNGLPAEGQAPVEVPTVVGAGRGHRFVEHEAVEVDGNDIGTHHGGGLFHNPQEQGLKPAVETLTCTPTNMHTNTPESAAQFTHHTTG